MSATDAAEQRTTTDTVKALDGFCPARVGDLDLDVSPPINIGLFGLGPIPKPYGLADFLQGRPFPAPPVAPSPLATLDDIARLTDCLASVIRCNEAVYVALAASKKPGAGAPPETREARSQTRQEPARQAAREIWIGSGGKPPDGVTPEQAYQDIRAHVAKKHGINLGKSPHDERIPKKDSALRALESLGWGRGRARNSRRR